MTAPQCLLAKRPADPTTPNRRETLVAHVLDVLETAQAVLSATGNDSLLSVGLSPDWASALTRAVRLSLFLHDLGKANSHAQRMLSRHVPQPQALRHEWISAWLPLHIPDLNSWLFAACPEHERYAVLAAVLGHHLKADDGRTLTPRPGSGSSHITVFLDHEDVREILDRGRELLDLEEPPILERIEIDLIGPPRPLGQLRDFLRAASEWFDQATRDHRVFVAVVKALTIAVDVAGSVVPRHGLRPGAWARTVLGRRCSPEELRQVAFVNLDGRTLWPFQEQVARSEAPVTFVSAGCGGGKTAAAYLWAQRHAVGRKLFFCYPTTGTATEGYRDYILPPGLSEDAALVHSRAEFDLEGMLDSEQDGPKEQSSRIEALRMWDAPLILCTVDQVLCLVQNGRSGLFSFPPIAASALVFDEIHLYDDRMFCALLRFLEAFRGAPALLMTATLPEHRLRVLRQCLARRGIDLPTLNGPPELESARRYRLAVPISTPPWEEIEATLSSGGKVLWVANSVGRCVAFAEEAYKRCMHPICYHSRFRYCDRILKHEAVIAAFKATAPALTIATQVCEVSLDISADLLVTDLASVPALIQRLGRLYRHLRPGDPVLPRQAIILEPQTAGVYQESALEQARQWLAHLGSGAVSQTDLAEAFRGLAEDEETIADRRSEWLDGGPFSRPAPLREDGYTIPVIMERDAGNCLDPRGRPISREVARYCMPMLYGPVSKEIGRWRRIGHAFKTPEDRIEYSDRWGGQWASPASERTPQQNDQ